MSSVSATDWAAPLRLRTLRAQAAIQELQRFCLFAAERIGLTEPHQDRCLALRILTLTPDRQFLLELLDGAPGVAGQQRDGGRAVSQPRLHAWVVDPASERLCLGKSLAGIGQIAELGLDDGRLTERGGTFERISRARVRPIEVHQCLGPIADEAVQLPELTFGLRLERHVLPAYGEIDGSLVLIDSVPILTERGVDRAEPEQGRGLPPLVTRLSRELQSAPAQVEGAFVVVPLSQCRQCQERHGLLAAIAACAVNGDCLVEEIQRFRRASHLRERQSDVVKADTLERSHFELSPQLSGLPEQRNGLVGASHVEQTESQAAQRVALLQAISGLSGEGQRLSIVRDRAKIIAGAILRVTEKAQRGPRLPRRLRASRERECLFVDADRVLGLAGFGDEKPQPVQRRREGGIVPERALDGNCLFAQRSKRTAVGKRDRHFGQRLRAHAWILHPVGDRQRFDDGAGTRRIVADAPQLGTQRDQPLGQARIVAEEPERVGCLAQERDRVLRLTEERQRQPDSQPRQRLYVGQRLGNRKVETATVQIRCLFERFFAFANPEPVGRGQGVASRRRLRRRGGWTGSGPAPSQAPPADR